MRRDRRRVAILGLSLSALATAAFAWSGPSAHSPLPDSLLAGIRGGEGGLRGGGYYSCDEKNTGAGQISYNDCVTTAIPSGQPCVYCLEDAAFSYRLDEDGFPVIMGVQVTCSGDKYVGTCDLDPMTAIPVCTPPPNPSGTCSGTWTMYDLEGIAP